MTVVTWVRIVAALAILAGLFALTRGVPRLGLPLLVGGSIAFFGVGFVVPAE